MTGSIPPAGPLAYDGQVSVPYIVKRFNPDSTFNKFPLPTLWVNPEDKTAFVSVSKDLGTTEWVEIGNGTTSDKYPTTPYVVGVFGKAGYQTIQSAVNAANTAGGGIVVVQPGNYTENLTLYNGVHITGLTFADAGGGVNITGMHTPPESGGFVFNNVRLISSTNIFDSSAAGTSHLVLGNAEVFVTDGYTFNLPNWTGKLESFDVNAAVGTNDGYVNNIGGAEVDLFEVSIGSGTLNPMIVSGFTLGSSANLYCEIRFQTGSAAEFDSCFFGKKLTFSNNSSGTIANTHIDTGSSAAIVMSSSANWTLSNVVINSTNSQAITGAGAGDLILSGISFVSNTVIEGTVNAVGAGGFLPAQFGNAGEVFTSNGPGVVPSFQPSSSTSKFPITPYVVGPSGLAGYQTIQSAINAANTAGSGTVFIQPGTYTENITLYNGVNLLAFPGEFGANGLNTASGAIPSVTIVGNTVIDTSALSVNSYNSFSNILFSPTTGDSITFISNQAYESVLSLEGCSINVTEAGKVAFSCDGFPTINLLNCSISETNVNTCSLLSVPGTYRFSIINAKNTAFNINSVNPCVIESGSDVHFNMSDCIYSSMIDISSSTGSFFSLNASNTVFSWDGASNNPLISVGTEEGSIKVDNSSCLSCSGAFLTANTPASNTFSVITSTNFVNTVNLYGDAIDQYSGCTFNTGASPAILMNATGNVSFNSCTVNSSANPAIDGTGVGTLTLGGITFTNNAIIAGTLTVAGSAAFLPAQFGSAGQVFTSNGPGVVPSFQTTGTAIDKYPISPYVVGPVGKAGYQTIQSALNAANSAGGGIVFVQPGTYTENLTLYDNTQVVGALGLADIGDLIISGVHTPPLSGGFVFRNVFLQGSTGIFSSAAAGSTHLIIADAAITVTNGYTFNLPNWTGKFEVWDVNDRSSTNDGFANNTGGAEIAFFSCAVGAGTANPMVVSGPVSIFTCDVGCPINLVTGANAYLEQNVHTADINFLDNSTGEVIGSEIDGNIVMDSSGAWLLANNVINTATTPAIGGSGSGTLTMGSTTFVSDAIISGALTVTGTTAFLPAQFGTTGQVFTSNGPGVVPSFQTPSAGNDLHIAKYIVSAGGLASGANYTTIASAIAAASSGDTIYLSDGTYTENITMKNGVNLVSLGSTSSFATNQKNNVVIIGKMIDGGSAVMANFTGINFQTNSDYVASLTGASTFNYFGCSFTGQNNTIFNATNASSRFNVDTCDGDLKTTGIAYYSMTNGSIFFNACNLSNSGLSTTPSTISAGTAYFAYTQTNAAIQSTGTAGTTALYSQFYTGGLNITAVTLNGTQANGTAIGFSYLTSGTASALSIGTGVTCDVYSCTVQSSNANAITGAGAITYGALTFNGSSSNINTTTKQPFNYLVPAGGTTNYVLTNTGATTPPTWQPAATLFNWSDTSGTVTAASNNGYFITGLTTSTLPASPANGDVIRYVVNTASLLTIRAAGTQLIRSGTSISSAGGTAINTQIGDAIELVYRSTGTTWFAFSGLVGGWNFA